MYNGAFLWIFQGDFDFFDPKIALRYTQDNLGVKKVSAPLKNPSKCPIICPPAKKKYSELSKSAVH
jgi:hypothetical protein